MLDVEVVQGDAVTPYLLNDLRPGDVIMHDMSEHLVTYLIVNPHPERLKYVESIFDKESGKSKFNFVDTYSSSKVFTYDLEGEGGSSMFIKHESES